MYRKETVSNYNSEITTAAAHVAIDEENPSNNRSYCPGTTRQALLCTSVCLRCSVTLLFYHVTVTLETRTINL